MIPKDSTPIKNKILINILARGLLSKDEMRIIFYIIRWSWGFNGVGRRQDWTKELKKRRIADDIGMDEGYFNKIINKMILENKIMIKDKCYQFNEHYDKWKLEENSSFVKLVKTSSKTCEKIKLNLTKPQVKLVKNSSLDTPNNTGDSIKNKDLNGGEHLSKETLKDNKDNKERVQNQPFRPLIKERKPANNIEFDFELWSWHGIDDDIKDRWAKIFPNVEVEIELNKIREFFKKHLGHEKIIKEKFNDNYAIYIFDWLARAEKYIKEKGS